MLQKVVSEDPEDLPSPEVPHALAAIVRRAMQKDPGARYQQCDELLAELTAYAGTTPQPGSVAATPPSTGRRRIGRYDIVEQIGSGGMGTLYRAHDDMLQRDVAIKVMTTDILAESGSRELFQQEARAAAKLQHRNVVTIHDLGEVDETPFIVMELLGGRDLAEVIRDGPELSLGQKLNLVDQLCAGLEFAHAQGIVHRDIKPPNVRVLDDGTVKILDFGIARVQQGESTQSRVLGGSPAYMAPEQLSEGHVDGRADLFSVGVLLYEFISGRAPFEGESPLAVVYEVLNAEPPRIDEVIPGLPEMLGPLVSKMLHKDPESRYQSARDVRFALQRVRAQVPVAPGDRTDGGTLLIDPTPAATDASHLVDVGYSSAALGPSVVGGRRWPRRLVVAALMVGAIVGAAVVTAQMFLGELPTVSRASRDLGTPLGAIVAATLASDPPGARIIVDGTESEVLTPATIPLVGPFPKQLQLTLAGFETVEVTIADPGAGVFRQDYALERLQGSAIVTVAGSYPFRVLQDDRVISGAAVSHRLELQVGPTVLRLQSAEYFLNRRVDITTEPDEPRRINAPALGALAVFSSVETCSVIIDGRDVGFPPIPNQPIVQGTHTVTLQCPDGTREAKRVTIPRDERAVVTFKR